MKETIYHTFGIDVRQFTPYGSYQSFQTAEALFLIVTVSHLREEELSELYHISQYLLNAGDPYVAVFELTNEEKPTFTHGKEQYALLKKQRLRSQAARFSKRQNWQPFMSGEEAFHMKYPKQNVSVPGRNYGQND
ncbi:hypothetical protein BsIDN1_56870 [Bacillus safensis]|uniref:Uncharacterized protein n=1 Tax=Bacillus safensis TaxID=561879 RepID=A0A5S9MJQ6_BACIA|nr:hypothetical protein BsIDN1_56870 [Bacillus safensis]